MFRVSPAKYDEGLDALKFACDGADNIAYRTDLLLADLRPLAEGKFGEASAERGAEVGLKAKLLSLSLFALLETMRAGREKLDAVVAARAELDAVAGSGAAEPTDPALDATVNVSDSASILEGSANGVVAALAEAAELLVGIGWTGRLPDELAQAADGASRQVVYAQSVDSAYAEYVSSVEEFEASLVPKLDPDDFLQAEAVEEWALGKMAEGDGIGRWLGALGDVADAAGDPLDGIAAVLVGFGTAVEGNEVALARAYAALKGLGPDAARALSELLSCGGGDEFLDALEESFRRRGGDLVAAMGDIDWIKFGVDEEAAETFVSIAMRDADVWSDDAKMLDELGDAAIAAGERFGKYADHLGKVAAGIDLLLAISEAGPVGPEQVSRLVTEGTVLAAAGTIGTLSKLGIGGIAGGFVTGGAAIGTVYLGLKWEQYMDFPEGEDFQRKVDSFFMGATGFGSVRPNDYFSEAGKREQLAAAEGGKDE